MHGVTTLVPKPIDPAKDRWLRRQAIQIAAQLPDDEREAIAVLEHTKTLVRAFLAIGEPS